MVFCCHPRTAGIDAIGNEDDGESVNGEEKSNNGEYRWLESPGSMESIEREPEQ
jgi:hypothetical protein